LTGKDQTKTRYIVLKAEMYYFKTSMAQASYCYCILAGCQVSPDRTDTL